MSNYEIQKSDYKNIDSKIKIVFITSEFNRNYTERLEENNQKVLRENWFKNIAKYLVPWAVEIPWFLSKLIKKQKPDLVFCFWVVVRWATTHYDMVAWESARWIMDISINNDIAIINWILTCENNLQVEERLESKYAISWLNLLSERNKI